MSDLVLNCKNVGEIAIESFRPNVCPVVTVNELSGHAHARASLSYAAFQDKVGAEFFADVLHLSRPFFVSERSVTRNDGKRRNLREISNDVLGDAIAEIFLLGIAAHIGERQDGNCWAVLFHRSHIPVAGALQYD